MTNVNAVSGFNQYPDKNNKIKKQEQPEPQDVTPKVKEESVGDELILSTSEPENGETPPEMFPWIGWLSNFINYGMFFGPIDKDKQLMA